MAGAGALAGEAGAGVPDGDLAGAGADPDGALLGTAAGAGIAVGVGTVPIGEAALESTVEDTGTETFMEEEVLHSTTDLTEEVLS